MQVNLSELAKTLGLPDGHIGSKKDGSVGSNNEVSPKSSRRKSMERMEMIKMTPDNKKWDNKDKDGKFVGIHLSQDSLYDTHKVFRQG